MSMSKTNKFKEHFMQVSEKVKLDTPQASSSCNKYHLKQYANYHIFCNFCKS